MPPGSTTLRRRALRLAALASACAWLVLAAPAASAITVEGAVADAVAGTSGAPAGTVLTVFVSPAPGTRVPRGVQIGLGPGLAFGATGPACDLATVRAEPLGCPSAAQAAEGVVETADGAYRITAFTLSAGALALRYETLPAPSLVDVTTATLDAGRQTLTAALPSALRGRELVTMRLRLGGMDPAADWVRSTICPNGTWTLSASLIDDAGVVASGGTSIGCRPPRRAQLGTVTPLFSLGRTRRNGRLSPPRLTAASLPAGLPADATVYVRCRAGCRGAWRSRVNTGGATVVRVRPGIVVGRPGLRLEVSVASPSIRGTYLVIAFTRGGEGRVNGWRGVQRGCVRLGSSPVRMSCPR